MYARKVTQPLSSGTPAPRDPKHRLLQRQLAAVAEAIGPGGALPSERELMTRYDVSRATVRRAIDTLAAEHVVEREQGRGTFVARSRVRSSLHLASFSHDMRRRGLEPSSRVIGLSRMPTSGSTASFFDGAAAWRLERLRLADGEPMAVEVGWVSAELVEDLDRADLTGSLYTVLANDHDCEIDAADQTVWASHADLRLAGLLDLEPGAPLLTFERHSRSRGRPVEHVTSWYRGDRYSLHVALTESPRCEPPLPGQGDRTLRH